MLKKIRDYLYGAKDIQTTTDNNPLAYALTSANLDATGQIYQTMMLLLITDQEKPVLRQTPSEENLNQQDVKEQEKIKLKMGARMIEVTSQTGGRLPSECLQAIFQSLSTDAP